MTDTPRNGPEDPTFFETPDDFRRWLEEHHERAEVLWVGYYKKATGRPGYRRTALHWVTSAERQATRDRRLDTLIEDSAAGRRIGPLRRSKGS